MATPTATDASLTQETFKSPYGFAEPVDEAIAAALASGYKKAAIARALGLSYSTILSRVGSETFQAALRVYLDEVHVSSAQIKARIEMLAALSLEKLAGLLESRDEKVVESTAFGLLDRAGHSVKQKSEITHTIQIDRETGEILEATFHEVNGAKHGDDAAARRLPTP